MKNKLIALVLSLALILSLFILPAGAAAPFPDVTDPATAETVGVLKQLGVINGKPDGTFDPKGAFSRAEFCKMALVILDRQGEAALQSTRVIFTDVTASHWALGYVNAAAMAAEGSAPLIQGMGDGRFAPNDPITYGAAVAILMRALGYADQDVASGGGEWYAGYLAKARALGLLNDLPALSGKDTLTRAQAAQLFYNLLFTTPKSGTSPFLASVLGGSVTDAELILSIGSTPLASGGYAIQTDKKKYKTYRSDLSDGFRGQRAQLVMDRAGNVLTFHSDDEYVTRTVRVLSAESRYVVTDTQEQLIVPSTTPVWQENGAASGTYGQLYAKGIPYGSTAIFTYDKADNLVSIFVSGSASGTQTAVAASDTSPFAAILDTRDVVVYKDGAPSSLAAVKKYDVGVYDSHSGVLNVYDRKLTGVYENASPSPISPDKIQVMGHAFTVLNCALADLTAFQMGDPVTLLLDGNNHVAGVVSPSAVTGQVYGIPAITSQVHYEYDSDGTPIDYWYTYDAKVTLAIGTDDDPIVVSGSTSNPMRDLDLLAGKLVGVSSKAAGELTLTFPDTTPASGSWDVQAGTLAGRAVSAQATIYDKTPNGPLVKVGASAITQRTVASDKIAYYHTDNAGIVDLIILQDVTHDCYTFGAFIGTETVSSGSGSVTATNTAAVIQNKGTGAQGVSFITGQNMSRYAGMFLGVAPSLVKIGDVAQMDGLLTLQSASIRRSAIGDGVVTVNGQEFPLSSTIDQCCYNTSAKAWFDSLEDALAYSSFLTVYFDGPASQGGKVRIIATQ